jgi:hypothetical protein
MVTAVLHGCEGWQGAPEPESQNPAEINQRERELQAGTQLQSEPIEIEITPNPIRLPSRSWSVGLQNKIAHGSSVSYTNC